MNKKLEDILHTYQQLSADLTNPAIVNNAQKLKEVSQEYSRLEPVAAKITQLKKLEDQLLQAQQTMTDDNDEELITIAAEEVKSLTEAKMVLEKDIENDLKPKDLRDGKNVIMEIRAGTGGDEAALFAAELFRLYQRYAESQGWRTKILNSNQIGIGGYKEVIFEIAGQNVYSNFKYESGTHRVQRVPDTEKNGRVHTSTITVAVMAEAEEYDLVIKSEDLKIDVFRAGGHGGQSVNTTDSAVRITHLPTNTVVSCQDEKSQAKNKDKAMKILRSRILAAEQEKLDKQRRQERKSQIGSGDRAEKIRTYNFPQDRITDHRANQNWNNITTIMNGKLQPIIDALKAID